MYKQHVAAMRLPGIESSAVTLRSTDSAWTMQGWMAVLW